MPRNIPQHTLLVISDTPARKRSEETIEVFEPVLRELNELSGLFDKIIWLTCDAGMGKYILKECTNDKVQVVIMPSVHHPRFNWLWSLLNYPVFVFYILKYIPQANFVHTRGPSHPALIAVLISAFDSKRQYWHKYAGNWGANRIPFMYGVQRRLLKALKGKHIKVTVNGNWADQNTSTLSFENPCLTDNELIHGSITAALKNFDADISILFVGNLNVSKGILNLLSALQSGNINDRVTNCYIVGDGPLRERLTDIAGSTKKINVQVIGTINRVKLEQYYEKSHFLVLPSASEGFPKVIAEAAAYGCIPIVTNISAIPQYIQTCINGYLLDNNNPETIVTAINDLLSNENLKDMSNEAAALAPRFTYKHYVDRICNEVFTLQAPKG